MNVSFYIARRYLLSQKTHNIINWISGISMIGVAVGTASLISVLSAFNGLENLVSTMFSVFDPDIKISLVEGKTFRATSIRADEIKNIAGVIKYTEVVEENALIRSNNKQHLVMIKGVDVAYQNDSPLDSLMVAGNLLLQKDSLNFAVIGYGVAYALGINVLNPNSYITAYLPRRISKGMNITEYPFKSSMIQPMGVFSVLQDFDNKYVLAPIRWVRNLLDYTDELTCIEIRTQKGADIEHIKKKIAAVVGNKFKAQNRIEQQELMSKMMKSEKWGVFLILTFILVVASFNTISSLIMLIIDKKKDIKILQGLGANHVSISRIFFLEGLAITLIGAIAGLFVGAGVCYLQQQFGLIKLQGGSSFAVSVYPVKMIVSDFVYVFITVFTIGFIAAWAPSRKIFKTLK